MTPDAKKALAATIQSLRARLLVELHDATESAYQLSIPLARDAALNEAGHKKRARLEVWIGEQVRGAVEATLTEKRKPSWSAEKIAQERARIEDELVEGGLGARIRADVEKAAAYTLLNRLVLIRLLEAGRHASAQVLTGGWQSGGYRAFRELNPALVREDESEGYAFVLQMVFEDLAGELPGLFGSASISELVPVPTSTLRQAVEALDDPELISCWTDDMTLGWVYQYWNDPEREALDAKLNAGGKVERHEIASKTQMFTERYMVDWLLQNSLGPMWLAMCQKQNWTAEAVADGTLDRLEARRVAWRAKRDAGEVSLTALMPVAPGMEQRWAYFVPQPIPADAVEKAAESVRDLRILDPAVGSGHFLIVAFDLLVALYREEARHRGEVGLPKWSDKAICERILEHNLSGIDLDPRAVQIAAAALWLKARQTCPGVHPRRINLVASALKLGSLPEDDPALVELRREVARETGIPGDLTDALIHALKGADHLGSLLKVDEAVDAAISTHEATLSKSAGPVQAALFGPAPVAKRVAIGVEEAKATVLERIEGFLARHTRGDDLGLRLRGEQLAAGVRFVRMVREGSYDLVVGNPPYQGTAKMDDAAYVQATYPRGKADLYAAFLERGLQLVREGGTSALLTMRNWMFIKQYVGLRTWLLETYDLRALGDFAVGAFDSVPNDVLSVVVSVFRRDELNRQDAKAPRNEEVLESVALQPTALDDRSYDRERTARKRAAVLAGVGRVWFNVASLSIVGGYPLVYYWSAAFLDNYRQSPKVGDDCEVRAGMTTGNNARFLRWFWEAAPTSIFVGQGSVLSPGASHHWVPYVRGAPDWVWVDPVATVIRWQSGGLEKQVIHEFVGSDGGGNGTPSGQFYFQIGISFTMIGADFSARVHRRRSIFGDAGSSAFPKDVPTLVCILNAAAGRAFLNDVNPTVNYKVEDVNRVAIVPIANADEIFATIEAAFTLHESHREPSVEFTSPGPSPWRHAQAWAQLAVDRPEGAPLPEIGTAKTPRRQEGLQGQQGQEPSATSGLPSAPWRLGALAVDSSPVDHPEGVPLPELGTDKTPRRQEGQHPSATSGLPSAPWRLGALAVDSSPFDLDPEPPTDHLSFALGCALGRFGPHGEGILDPATANLDHALPSGILFLDGTLDPADRTDSLGHPAAGLLHHAWAAHPTIAPGAALRDYLRASFFTAVHRQMYDNRPIHWPLSSKKKTFVAWVTIHRWTERTLRDLLADHLYPTQTRLTGQVTDLRATRDGADKTAARNAERRLGKIKPALDELAELIALVEQCAESGPPPTHAACQPREVDARYAPDLDDGVMINAAALWPLLAPQWKDPAKWWSALASPTAKKHFDWAHLAMRYWPTRVDARCQEDPSLGVAHGCFWAYHPKRAWAWELRLQDEIGPDFRITEAPYQGDGGDKAHRAAYLRDQALEALATVETEALRRRRKKKAPQSELSLLEAGLWTSQPRACWELELAIIERQGEDFQLLAPDEEDARAALLKSLPVLAADRLERLQAAQQRLGFATPDAEPDDDSPADDEETEGEE